jgi:hypothetical protein
MSKWGVDFGHIASYLLYGRKLFIAVNYMTLRLLICGGRDYDKLETVRQALTEATVGHGEIIVINGACRGADQLGAQCARELGLTVITYPAKRDQYGRAAGPIRNQQMLDEGQPDLALIFHSALEHGRGTKDMWKRLQRAKIPYRVYS